MNEARLIEQKKNDGSLSMVLFITSTLIAVIYCAFNRFQWESVDTKNYIDAAITILEGREYPKIAQIEIDKIPSPDFFPFFRAPAYPYFVASLWFVFGRSYTIILIAQSLIHGLTTKWFYELSYNIFGSRKISLVTGLGMAIYPNLLIFVRTVSTECLHVLFVLGFVRFLLYTTSRSGFHWRSPIICGIFAGIGSLNRPTLLHIAICVSLSTAMFSVMFYSDFKSQFQKWVVCMAAMIGVIIPWTISNVSQGRGLFLINNASGWALWSAYHPRMMDLYKPIPDGKDINDIVSEGIIQASFDQIDEWNINYGYHDLNTIDQYELWKSGAIGFIRENPSRSISLIMNRFLDYWRPWLNPKAYGLKKVLLSAIFYIPLFVLGFKSLSYPKSVFEGQYANCQTEILKIFRFEVIALFCFSTIPHALTYSTIRYRIPYIEPYLMMFAVYSIYNITILVNGRLKSLYSRRT